MQDKHSHARCKSSVWSRPASLLTNQIQGNPIGFVQDLIADVQSYMHTLLSSISGWEALTEHLILRLFFAIITILHYSEDETKEGHTTRVWCRYIGHNAAILHKYANEDVSVGSWLVGLDVYHDDERRFCCESEGHCSAQVRNSNQTYWTLPARWHDLFTFFVSRAVSTALTDRYSGQFPSPRHHFTLSCASFTLDCSWFGTRWVLKTAGASVRPMNLTENSILYKLAFVTASLLLQVDEASLCISYYERQCAGICNSESRLEGIWRSCLDRPLEKRLERE